MTRNALGKAIPFAFLEDVQVRHEEHHVHEFT